MSAKQEVMQKAGVCGLSVGYHNPGDGTKVRIFDGLGHDFFDSHPIFRTDGKNGWAKALLFLEGYIEGFLKGKGV
jgi:hypothetical protein